MVSVSIRKGRDRKCLSIVIKMGEEIMKSMHIIENVKVMEKG